VPCVRELLKARSEISCVRELLKARSEIILFTCIDGKNKNEPLKVILALNQLWI
jgi:hypothetical protein